MSKILQLTWKKNGKTKHKKQHTEIHKHFRSLQMTEKELILNQYKHMGLQSYTAHFLNYAFTINILIFIRGHRLLSVVRASCRADVAQVGLRLLCG